MKVLIKKIVEQLSNEELKAIFLEIEEWMKSGILKQDGTFKEVHRQFEDELGFDQSLKVTEDAVLFEIAKRFSNNIVDSKRDIIVGFAMKEEDQSEYKNIFKALDIDVKTIQEKK